MEAQTRVWVTPEQAGALDTPVGNCAHDRRGLVLMTSKKETHGILSCLGCGTYFDFLGHTDFEVTDELKAIEINRRRKI